MGGKSPTAPQIHYAYNETYCSHHPMFLWFPLTVHTATLSILTQLSHLGTAVQHTHSIHLECLPHLPHKLPTTSLFSFPIPLLLPYFMLLLSFAKIFWYLQTGVSVTKLPPSTFHNLQAYLSKHRSDYITPPQSLKLWPTNVLYHNLPACLLKMQIPEPNSTQIYWIRRRGPPVKNQ